MRGKIDVWILVGVTGLIFFSLFSLFGVKRDLLLNQLTFSLIGYLVLFLSYRVGTNFLRLNSRVYFAIFVILLVSTFVFGENIRGSRRWISVFFFNFQPSEFFKPFFVLLIADLFASRASQLKKLALSATLFLVPTVLILRQPDLGNAIIYTGVYIALLFFSGTSMIVLFSGGIAMIILMPFFWHLMRDYQRARIISFVRPDAYYHDIAYNLIQSVITVGSGAFMGRGLGFATQSRFLFLPEYHTDFAYASLVEQFGFVGGAAVIGLFALLLYRLILKARNVRSDPFAYLFIVGCSMFILISVCINVGMNLGLMPVTGIALPFISYGGSSIISTMAMFGLLLSL